MSPVQSDAPETPDRKSSSSALFHAFRTLTGTGRAKSQSLISSPSVTRVSSADPTSVRSDTPSGSWQNEVEANVNGSVANKNVLGRVSSRGFDGSRWEDLVGGPPELTPLLARLDKSRSIAERIDAIPEICRILDGFPVNNVLVLWSAASDLLSEEDRFEPSQAAYTLLKSCVKIPNLTSIERNTFFSAITQQTITEHTSLRFQALSELTNGGRNVEAFESLLAPFLAESLQTCFTAARQARKLGRRAKTEGSYMEDRNLDEVFKFINDILRFNGKVFKECDLQALLNQIIVICRETTREPDMQNAVNLFGTLVTYTQIPLGSLRPTLEVLCDVHRQLPGMQDQTWTALGNLLKSHMGPSSVAVILDILNSAPASQSPNRNPTRGAVHVLHRLTLLNGAEGLPKVALSQLVPALKAAVTNEHKKLENEVLEFITQMLGREDIVLLLLEAEDWSDMMDAIEMCVRNHVPYDGDVDDEKKGLDNITELSYTASETTVSDSLSRSKSKAARSVFRQLLERLEAIQPRADFVKRTNIMRLFMRLSHQITDSAIELLLKFHAEERLLHPSNTEWKSVCSALIQKIFQCSTRPRGIRQRVVELLCETYNTIEGVYPDDVTTEYAMTILRNIPDEEDLVILALLVDFAVSTVTYGVTEFFDLVLPLLSTVLEKPKQPLVTIIHDIDSQTTFGSRSNIVMRGLVLIFMRCMNREGRNTIVLFDVLLNAVKSPNCETDARISALKLLFRIRCDSRHALFLISTPEGESMAAVLARTAETAVGHEAMPEGPIVETHKTDEEKSTKESRIFSSPSPHSSLSRQLSRTANLPTRISRLTPPPPLWIYPGPHGLPDDPSPFASIVCFSHIDSASRPLSESRHVLTLALWLEIIIGLLQNEEEWEVYSYVLAHLGAQLSNHSLFRDCVPQIRMLRGVLCDQIRATSFNEPPVYTSLKKGDVAVCLYHLLTILVSYHEHFEKSEEDDMVRIFVLGIGSWDKASKWCIHAISVCCHELPLSTSKSLGLMIQKMSEVITQPQLAVHILEFLVRLGRLPELYYNFHEENYRTVFGVSFRYLQYARDQREKGTNVPMRTRHSGFGTTLRHTSGSRDLTASPEYDQKMKMKSVAEDLPQYLHALAYHVITYWFIALKMEDRKRYIPWITRNLIYRDRSDREVIEEQAQVTMDMMEVFAYSDRDETAPDPNFAQVEDGEVTKKTWIVGYSLLTIETAARTGLSQITTRRPSGTKYFTLQPLLTKPPRHQVPIHVGLSAEAFYTSAYVGVLPDAIFQNLYSPLSFPSSLSLVREEPVSLPADDMIARAISAFDRNSTVDNHKVGVLYVGDGQADEMTILANIMGSSDYTSFVSDLGTLTRLKGAKFNTAGLDREYNSDGEFTYCWRDRCTEIVFHITTMMPTDRSNDQSILRKKSHVGNDYVNIIFNNSGRPYKFSTIASQFNYVVIVITPEARSSFVETRLESDSDGHNRAYRVQVMVQPGFPDISPAAVEKVLTGKHLAAYIRLIALNACFFSLVWAAREGGESISPWRNRLREIKKLRDRHCDTTPMSPGSHGSAGNPTPPSTSSGSIMGGGPFGQSHPYSSASHPRDSGAAFKRTSVATFISEAASRSSVLSGSTTMEMERSGSERS